MPNNNSVLVTGASGFFGLNLVKRLSSLGYAIKTFGRSKNIHPQLQGLIAEHISGDIEAPGSLDAAMSGCKYVFHLAGLVSYRRTKLPELLRANVTGSRNAMQSALKAGVERFIHMSSIAAMGIPENGAMGDESIEYNLQGLDLHYCDSKHQGELAASEFAEKGLPIIMLNPGITFGDGDSHPHHHTIFQSISRNRLIGYPTGGVTFSDIEDVVYSCIAAMDKGRIGERYAIVSDNLTFKEASEIACKIIGGKAPTIPIPGFISETAGSICETIFPLFGKEPSLTRQIAWLSQRNIFFSSAKAQNELGLQPTPFAKTIARTAPYYLGILP